MSQLYLICKIELKTRKTIKSDFIRAKSVKSNRVYEFIKSIKQVIFLVLYE